MNVEHVLPLLTARECITHRHRLRAAALAGHKTFPRVAFPGHELVAVAASGQAGHHALVPVVQHPHVAAAAEDQVVDVVYVAEVVDAEVGAAGLMLAARRIKVDVTDVAHDGETALPEHAAVSVDHVDEAGVRLVEAGTGSGQLKGWLRRVEACDPGDKVAEFLGLFAQETHNVGAQAVADHVEVGDAAGILGNFVNKLCCMLPDKSCPKNKNNTR